MTVYVRAQSARVLSGFALAVKASQRVVRIHEVDLKKLTEVNTSDGENEELSTSEHDEL